MSQLVKVADYEPKNGGPTYTLYTHKITGAFSAYKENESHPEGIAFSDITLSGLRDKIDAAHKRTRVKIAVRFTTAKGEDGLVYGKHASNERWLVKVGGESVQLRNYELSDYGNAMRPLTDQEKNEFALLRETKLQATRAVDAFVKAHKFEDIVKACEQALDEAQTEKVSS